MKKQIYTERLHLRKLKEEDAKEALIVLGDDEVTKFLPMFHLQTLEDAKVYCKEVIKECEEKNCQYYVITRKDDDRMIGYIHVGGPDSYDFGYALHKAYWHQGIVSEAALAVLEQLKQEGLPYVTATHDINNPRSGEVMKRLGMKYCYSYDELWQPKNILVTFRMYQLNFDGGDFVYRSYWNQYPHRIENDS